MKYPKPTTERDKKYLAWIRTLPCLVCQSTPVHPHHEGSHGMGIKTSDRNTLPLCHTHHQERHDRGKVTFWGSIDTALIIERLIKVYEERM